MTEHEIYEAFWTIIDQCWSTRALCELNTRTDELAALYVCVTS